MKFTVSQNLKGKTLLEVLSHLDRKGRSKRHLKRMVEQGCCFFRGQIELVASKKVRGGDVLEFIEPLFEPLSPVNTFDNELVLYEDDDLVIVDKPPGIVCEKERIWEWIGQKRLKLVHRLDRFTSGVLILAKTNRAKGALDTLFKERKIEKEYWALTFNQPKSSKGTVESYLSPKKSIVGQTIWQSHREQKGGKWAHTQWVLDASSQKGSLLRLFPTTGRTHQIRVHLASIGVPIIGDLLYCKERCNLGMGYRHMLHARSIRFQHPFQQEEVFVEAALPQDFYIAAKQLALEI